MGDIGERKYDKKNKINIKKSKTVQRLRKTKGIS